MLNKPIITQNVLPVANCDEFLNALYLNAPEGLFLELRCIHPTDGQVRSLWTDVHNLKATLEQAKKLNEQGYGIYYAPCLRSEQKGNESTSRLLPALWIDIDCDDDDQQRKQGLNKLKTFDPAPSIILNSGGGWHGYWLLNEPFMLETDEHKNKVSAILKGLFTALDGDEGYVKSVASIMRLPSTHNTKPERDNACVQITEWHPDRRYSLSEFAWLEVKPTSNNHYTPMFSHNGNGNHVLPPRTEQYLASGAFKGDRNRELFAAACQLRDAGFSQTDAEAQLISRYVADGNGSENPAGREKEAKATIASAYSQSPRKPITSPKQHAREVVQKLVGNYPVKQKFDRPSTEDIVEAVEACVYMNAVEWAEQREKFKQITGDGLKIADIDRLYRNKKKEQERQRQQDYVDAESYVTLDGKIIYRKETYRGTMEKTVTDWTATALYQTCQVDDDGKQNHVTTIELKRGDKSKTLDVPGEVFVDDVALRRFIGSNAGAQYIVRAGMSKHLVPAIVQLSGEFPTHRHYNFMGWMELDGRWVYVSPTDCITAKGKLAESPKVELDQRLRDYGVKASSWKDSLQAFDAMIKVMPPELAPCLISFALLPVIQRFLPKTATRPAIHLVGTSGSGKSEIASLLSSFYGQFNRDTPPAQWGDTINTVEVLGYPLADALYWVDDYKDIYSDPRTFTRFLQAYSRNLGRGRLTREAKVRREKPCRGLILSTGETNLEGEMSVASRMLALQISPWKQRDPEGKALHRAEALRDDLSGFTAHFASWVAQQLTDNDLVEDITNRFSQNLRGYNAKLTAQLGKNEHHDRAVKNWAVLITVYQLLARFLKQMDEDYLLPSWQDVIVENVRALREERASEVFLDLLGQLLAGGQIVLDDDMKNPNEYPSNVTVVGYKDDTSIYLLPEIAFKAVNKVQTIHFSTTAIGMQLKEDGILIPGNQTLTVQRRVRGARVRLWQLKSDFLGCDTCDDVTAEQ